MRLQWGLKFGTAAKRGDSQDARHWICKKTNHAAPSRNQPPFARPTFLNLIYLNFMYFFLYTPSRALFPYAQLPQLTDGPASLVQSGAIARHIARGCGFSPSKPLESAAADVVAGGADDLRNAYGKLIYDPAFEQKRDAFERVRCGQDPCFFFFFFFSFFFSSDALILIKIIFSDFNPRPSCRCGWPISRPCWPRAARARTFSCGSRTRPLPISWSLTRSRRCSRWTRRRSPRRRSSGSF
jgi:hypothetical protein